MRVPPLLACLLLLTGCVTGVPAASQPPEPRRPNIVMIMADDLDTALLPYLPKTAEHVTARGTAFDRYYVNLAWCCPSRATTLTGRYAHNTGVWSNNPPNGGFREFYDERGERSSLAPRLRAAGYRTGLFGKYLNGYPEQVAGVPRTYVPPGWDTWVSPVAGHPFRGFDYTLNVDGALVHDPPSRTTYLTDVLAARTRAFVTDRDERPFFALVTPVVPHPPAVPAPRHAHLYPGLRAPRSPAYGAAIPHAPAEVRRLPRVTAAESARWDALFRARARSVAALDDLVERVVAALRDTGRLDDTYVVVTSDNGFHLGERRMPPGKNTGYETDVRVPFLVRGPGVPAGRRVSALAGNTDLAPTFLDLAGAPVPPGTDGRSLRPLLTGPAPLAWRRAFLLEHGPARNTHPATPSTPHRPYTPDTRPNFYLPDFTGIRTERHVYLSYATGERELYDTTTDPHQLDNLAGTGDPSEPALAHWLAALRHCTGATCRTTENRAP
ncbi:sulfatase family protein [Actinomadura flavalba]|uniref:sulfatase family protein n=1 Tax=Actinomadura flavalba TaxID=1120938 RepID=UPI000371DD4A|nr:sulfatase [Actinomadura flavalba]